MEIPDPFSTLIDKDSLSRLNRDMSLCYSISGGHGWDTFLGFALNLA